MLAGAGHRFEIWDKTLYDAEMDIDADAAMDELLARGVEVRL